MGDARTPNERFFGRVTSAMKTPAITLVAPPLPPPPAAPPTGQQQEHVEEKIEKEQQSVDQESLPPPPVKQQEINAGEIGSKHHSVDQKLPLPLPLPPSPPTEEEEQDHAGKRIEKEQHSVDQKSSSIASSDLLSKRKDFRKSATSDSFNAEELRRTRTSKVHNVLGKSPDRSLNIDNRSAIASMLAAHRNSSPVMDMDEDELRTIASTQSSNEQHSTAFLMSRRRLQSANARFRSGRNMRIKGQKARKLLLALKSSKPPKTSTKRKDNHAKSIEVEEDVLHDDYYDTLPLPPRDVPPPPEQHESDHHVVSRRRTSPGVFSFEALNPHMKEKVAKRYTVTHNMSKRKVDENAPLVEVVPTTVTLIKKKYNKDNGDSSKEKNGQNVASASPKSQKVPAVTENRIRNPGGRLKYDSSYANAYSTDAKGMPSSSQPGDSKLELDQQAQQQREKQGKQENQEKQEGRKHNSTESLSDLSLTGLLKTWTRDDVSRPTRTNSPLRSSPESSSGEPRFRKSMHPLPSRSLSVGRIPSVEADNMATPTLDMAHDRAEMLESSLHSSFLSDLRRSTSPVTTKPLAEATRPTLLTPTKVGVIEEESERAGRVHENHMHELNALLFALDNVAALSGLSVQSQGAKSGVEQDKGRDEMLGALSVPIPGSTMGSNQVRQEGHGGPFKRRLNNGLRKKNRASTGDPQRRWIGTTRRNTLIGVDHGVGSGRLLPSQPPGAIISRSLDALEMAKKKAVRDLHRRKRAAIAGKKQHTIRMRRASRVDQMYLEQQSQYGTM